MNDEIVDLQTPWWAERLRDGETRKPLKTGVLHRPHFLNDGEVFVTPRDLSGRETWWGVKMTDSEFAESGTKKTGAEAVRQTTKNGFVRVIQKGEAEE